MSTEEDSGVRIQGQAETPSAWFFTFQFGVLLRHILLFCVFNLNPDSCPPNPKSKIENP